MAVAALGQTRQRTEAVREASKDAASAARVEAGVGRRRQREARGGEAGRSSLGLPAAAVAEKRRAAQWPACDPGGPFLPSLHGSLVAGLDDARTCWKGRCS